MIPGGSGVAFTNSSTAVTTRVGGCQVVVLDNEQMIKGTSRVAVAYDSTPSLSDVAAHKLTGTDNMAESRFGLRIASNGSTVMIASQGDGYATHRRSYGAVYVYQRLDDGDLLFRQKLLASNALQRCKGDGPHFGCSLALSEDHAVIAAKRMDRGFITQAGGLFVFGRDADGRWTEEQVLGESDPKSKSNLGAGLAIKDKTIAAGRPGPTATPGAVYIFEKGRIGWRETAKLQAASARPGDYFGGACALTDNYLLIGAQGNRRTVAYACLFRRDSESPAGWTEVLRLDSPDGKRGDYFGGSVAMDEQSGVIVIGAPRCDIAGFKDSGAVYVYERSGTTANGSQHWMYKQKLVAPKPFTKAFYGTVALGGDRIAVGAKGYESQNDPPGKGGCYVYDREPDQEGRWVLRRELQSDKNDDMFGVSVALMEDDSVMVGASYDDEIAVRAGAAYAFDLDKED